MTNIAPMPMTETADVPREPSRLEVDIADVVACFLRWGKTADIALDADTISALHDLVASWKAHCAALVAEMSLDGGCSPVGASLRRVNNDPVSSRATAAPIPDATGEP